jgi:hypothetical protein
MKRWLIPILIAIPLALIGYQGLKVSNTYFNSLTLKETARSALAREVVKVRQVQLPRPPSIWPDSEKLIKHMVIEKGLELHIPLTENDIAVWRDTKNFYCRVAWNHDVKILTFPLRSILFDFTAEASIE